MGNKKCSAAGGPENCGRSNCPERVNIVDYNIPDVFIQQTHLNTKPVIPFGAWTNKDTVLFKTIHGSKLYGLANAGSDDDFYVITPTRYTSRQINAKQTIQGTNDVTAVDFSSFVKLVNNGVPQALEAMFSRKAKSDFFEDYRQAYYASDPQVIHTYMRTIKAFSLSSGNYKRRRHALRLCINLEELLYSGRFNPTLSKANAIRISRIAFKEDKQYLAELKKMSPIEVDWDNNIS